MSVFAGLDVYENVNPKIVELYDKEQTVLDIGCGSGALGAYLKSLNPQAVVHGLDISPEAGIRAAARLDRFACIDLDGASLPDFNTHYDLIIVGDVLEHIKRPDVLLSSLRSLLKKNGCIIVSVPNIANYSIRLRLLRGQFDYTETGIMDKTHLRFFTHKSIRSLLSACGYDIIAERYISRFGRLCGPRTCGLLAVQLIFKIRKISDDAACVSVP